MADSAPNPVPSKAAIFARRSFSTILLWAIVSTVFLGRWTGAFLGLIAVLILISTFEYFKMLKSGGVKCFPRFGFLMALGYCAALHLSLFQSHPCPVGDAVVIFLAMAGAFTLQLRHPIRGLEPLVAVAANVLGFIYIAWAFNFCARLLFLVPETHAIAGKVGDHGAFLLLWLLAVTKFTDMGAYITGSLIGRHKMIPHVSPGKTWEGFAGALLFAELAACGLFWLFPAQLSPLKSFGHAAALGLLLALLAVVGDLAESIVKRSLGAKDSGRVLPGIGGALDLIDSVCFTAPAMCFYLQYFLPPTA